MISQNFFLPKLPPTVQDDELITAIGGSTQISPI